MSIQITDLGQPGALPHARAIAHKAVQILTAAARANLPAQPDDSHSNLEWSIEKQAFLTHPIAQASGTYQIGLSLDPLTLMFLYNGQTSKTQPLAGQSFNQAMHWVDEHLQANGMAKASSAKIPYELPADVDAVVSFDNKEADHLGKLAAWHNLAAVTLQNAATNWQELSPSPIRCWPHHFDIATYVALEDGDAETARGIGVGMSAGDQAYNQPYFYVNPWPHLDVNALPDPIKPGHWHTEGFVGAIATGDEILTLEHIEQGMQNFLSEAFAAGQTRHEI